MIKGVTICALTTLFLAACFASVWWLNRKFLQGKDPRDRANSLWVAAAVTVLFVGPIAAPFLLDALSKLWDAFFL